MTTITTNPATITQTGRSLNAGPFSSLHTTDIGIHVGTVNGEVYDVVLANGVTLDTVNFVGTKEQLLVAIAPSFRKANSVNGTGGLSTADQAYFDNLKTLIPDPSKILVQ